MEAFLKDFDFALLLPELDTFLGQLRFYLGLFLTLGPLCMLIFGLLYYFKPTDSPKSRWGFRSYWTSGSDRSWQYAQKIAGMVFMILGGALFLVGLILSLFFGGMSPVTMATTALVTICIELALVATGYVLINRIVLKHFDADGNPIR